jgi:hypothetical protein
MPASGIELAQVREDVELLEERFGDDREIVAAANVLEVVHDPAVGPSNGFAIHVRNDAGGLEALKVSNELLSVEVRDRPTLVRVHGAS